MKFLHYYKIFFQNVLHLERLDLVMVKIPQQSLLNILFTKRTESTKSIKSVTSITPSASSSGNVQFGTNVTGKFSISHKIGKSNFTFNQAKQIAELNED